MVRLTGTPPTGTPSWIDLGIPDLERAKGFYGPLFGWEIPDLDGPYRICLLRGEPVAALMELPEPAPAYWWGLYFATDDCDGTVKRAIDAGGSVVTPPGDILGRGRLAILRDVVGAQFGLWEGREHIGSVIVNEPGSFVWNELFTAPADRERAGEFYRAVFDHTPDTEFPEPGFTALKRADGRFIGGIQGDPDTTEPSWVTYFAVADTDAAVQVVRERGGTVVTEPVDTPYGRNAVIKDPFGVDLRLMKPADPGAY